MFRPLTTLLALAPLLSSSSAAAAAEARIYATHYNGNVYTLSLTEHNGAYTLAEVSSMKACGDMPSWLTLDPELHLLYCSDETGDPTTNGSLSTFAISDDKDHSLKEITKTEVPGGGVHSVIYTGDDGKRYLAIAHYGGASLSTYTLPLTPQSEPHQLFPYKLPKPSPHPQQNTAHPHQVLLDPTNAYILSPDLGADQIRIYAIDKPTGNLSPCPPIPFPQAAGPRHAVFWTAPETEKKPETTLYTVNELNGRLNAYQVSYPSISTSSNKNENENREEQGEGEKCPTFKHIQSLTPYPGDTLPEGATLSEIRTAGSNIYVSVRTDQAFAPDDSVVTLRRKEDGTVELAGELTTSGGKVPRTMVVNRAGDLVVVGDQASSRVVVLKRDVESGELGGKVVASLDVGEKGKVGTAEGLSSVVLVE